jgi:hypothetical protein
MEQKQAELAQLNAGNLRKQAELERMRAEIARKKALVQQQMEADAKMAAQMQAQEIAQLPVVNAGEARPLLFAAANLGQKKDLQPPHAFAGNNALNAPKMFA